MLLVVFSIIALEIFLRTICSRLLIVNDDGQCFWVETVVASCVGFLKLQCIFVCLGILDSLYLLLKLLGFYDI